MPKGQREVMGNRWQFMFAVGEVMALAVIAVFLVADHAARVVWRVTLGLGAVPALIILVLRHDLPETAMWLIRQGRFREAKRVSRQMYNDNLDMLPDDDIEVPRPRPTAFLADIRKDPIRWRATLYGWIACFAQGSEFSTFAFYHPGAVRDGGRLVDIRHRPRHYGALRHRRDLRLGRAADHAENRPARHRHRRVRHRAGLAPGRRGGALYRQVVILPFAAAAMLWGHYWAASNCMTIPTMVAKPEYRGTASGFAYMFVKLPSFLAIFLFPSLFAAIGQANATLFVAIFPLIGLLAAIFILPEVYGFEHD